MLSYGNGIGLSSHKNSYRYEVAAKEGLSEWKPHPSPDARTDDIKAIWRGFTGLRFWKGTGWKSGLWLIRPQGSRALPASMPAPHLGLLTLLR